MPSNQPYYNRRARRAARKRTPAGDRPRYPRRSMILEVILPAMMAERSIDMVRDVSAARTVHLWGLACTDSDTAANVTHTVVDLDSDPLKSPILGRRRRIDQPTSRPQALGIWVRLPDCWRGDPSTGDANAVRSFGDAVLHRPASILGCTDAGPVA